MRRKGNVVLIEPEDSWPEDYVKSFRGVPADFVRPAQGKSDKREPLG